MVYFKLMYGPLRLPTVEEIPILSPAVHLSSTARVEASPIVADIFAASRGLSMLLSHADNAKVMAARINIFHFYEILLDIKLLFIASYYSDLAG